MGLHLVLQSGYFLLEVAVPLEELLQPPVLGLLDVTVELACHQPHHL
jgi:hypothetical protein